MKPVYLTPRSAVLTRILWVLVLVTLLNVLLIAVWIWPWFGLALVVVLVLSPILAWLQR